MTGNQPHVKAEVAFLRTMEGGLQRPVSSGQQFQLYYDGFSWDATCTYPGREWVYPGETVTASITFLSSETHRGRLYVGKEFELRQGAHVVARGRVTKLVDLK